jgi:hypothetical protein
VVRFIRWQGPLSAGHRLRTPIRGETIEQVSDPHLGISASVKFGRKPLGQGDGFEPERVQHDGLGITWHVTKVLDGWEYPGHVSEAYGQATVAEWWQLAVSGPLPGQPGESGRFIMKVSRYGDRPGWWVTVEASTASSPAQCRKLLTQCGAHVYADMTVQG